MRKPFILFFIIYTLHAQSQTTGAHYVLDHFSKGIVEMKSGERFERLLNYNILTGEIIFDSGNGFLALAEPQNVDTVTIAGRTFVPVEKVFYELLLNLPQPLFIEYTYTIKDAGAAMGYGMTTNTSAAIALRNMVQNGTAYSIKLPDDFQISVSHKFLLRKDGKYYEVSSAQRLSKVFPEKKDWIKTFVKNNDTDFSKQEDVTSIVEKVQQD